MYILSKFNQKSVIWFYFFSYGIIGISIFYSLWFSYELFPTSIDFNKTKLGINYILILEYFKYISAILACIIYIPFLLISNKVTHLIISIFKDESQITVKKFRTIRMMVIIFLSIFLSGNIYWVIDINVLWWDAIKYTLLSISLIVFTVASS